MTMNFSIGFITLAVFCFWSFGWTVNGVFIPSSSSQKMGYRLLKLGNVFTWLSSIVIWYYSSNPNSEKWIFGSIMLILDLVLFMCAKRVATKKLTLAFSNDSPKFILQEGPYRYIRHPFYTSYLFCYLIVAAVLNHWVLWINFSCMLAIYLWAALREEQKFKNSPLKGEYLLYRKKAGLFYPKIYRP